MTNPIQFSAEEYKRIEKCTNLEHCVKRLLSDDFLALATSRLYVKTMPFQHEIYCFDSGRQIDTFSTTIMLRQNVQFRKQFENIFVRLHEAGLISKWEKDYRQPYIDDENDLDAAYDLNTFKSCLFFYVIGLSLALFSRIVEEIVFRKNDNANVHQFWKFAEKLIDEKRHYFLLKED